MPPSHYMERDEQSGGYVARFYLDERGYQALLGANIMMGHDILFDVEEGSLGFAESHCDYTKVEEELADEEEAGATEGKTNEQNDESKIKSATTGVEVEATTKKYEQEEKTSSSDKGMPFVALTLAILFAGGGYVAYDRFGLREKLAQRRRHDRLPTNDGNGEPELELQYVNPNPIT